MVFVMCGLLLAMTGNLLAGDYTETSTKSFSRSGGDQTEHTFVVASGTGVASDGTLKVGLRGDFNSGSEYATVHVNGNHIGQHDGGSQCRVSYDYMTFTIAQSALVGYASGGQITVRVANSAGVNYCDSNRDHEVTLSFKTGASGTPPSDGETTASKIVTMTAANYQDVTVQANGIVNIEEVITLSGNYSRLKEDNLQIHGGGFIGTGVQEIDVGDDDAVVTGVYFKDVKLDGGDVLFRKCVFEGSILFPFDAKLTECKLLNVVSDSQRRLGSILNSEIEDSTIQRVQQVSDSNVSRSTIGGTDSYGGVGRMSSSRIDDSLVYLKDGSIFSGNVCDDTKVNITDDATQQIIVSGNNFDGILDGENEVIFVQANSASWRSFLISGNTFAVQNDDRYSILVTGTPQGPYYYQMLNISNNNFLKGEHAIGYVGNFKTFVSGNFLRQTDLGVSHNGSYLHVMTDNIELR